MNIYRKHSQQIINTYRNTWIGTIKMFLLTGIDSWWITHTFSGDDMNNNNTLIGWPLLNFDKWCMLNNIYHDHKTDIECQWPMYAVCVRSIWMKWIISMWITDKSIVEFSINYKQLNRAQFEAVQNARHWMILDRSGWSLRFSRPHYFFSLQISSSLKCRYAKMELFYRNR